MQLEVVRLCIQIMFQICFKYSNNISDEHRNRICKDYYSLPDSTSKMQFLCGTVTEGTVRHRLEKAIDCSDEQQVKKRRVSRETSRQYFLTKLDGEKFRVCQRMFCSTFTVSYKVVNRALQGRSSTGVYTQPDGRSGRSPKNKIPDDRIRFVKQHIDGFPRIEPHYCRKKSQKQYLSPELNIRQMHRLYRDDFCLRMKIIPLKEHKYRSIFITEYNLKCFVPKKDQCTTCNASKSASDVEKAVMKEEHTNLHECTMFLGWSLHQRSGSL